MTSIPEYSATLYNGEPIHLAGLAIQPPDPDEPDAGFAPGVYARQVVELHRALSAWLSMHRRQHPDWHADYRRTDPGGKVVPVPLGEFTAALRRHVPFRMDQHPPAVARALLIDMRGKHWIRIERNTDWTGKP